MTNMTKKEERVWQFLLMNRGVTAYEAATICDVSEEFVQKLIDRISSPNWREEVKPKPLRCQSPNWREEVKPKPLRCQLLDEASRLTAGDRERDYGSPVPNMQRIADIFNAWNVDGVVLTARHITMVHQATKMARRAVTPTHRDSYVDNMAYCGIEYECATSESNKS